MMAMASMAEKRDYYDVLGVGRDATEAQIAEAYRKLALKYHPDRNPGDESAVARFKEAAEAFEVLGDAEKRARYDRYGHAGLEGGVPQFHDVADIFDHFSSIFGDDLFGSFFGGRPRRGGRRGDDVAVEITIELAEAARGASREIEFERWERCTACGGSGARPGSRPDSCPYCGGRGHIVQSAGFFRMQTTCPSCHGQGAVVRDHCESCRGSGRSARRVARKVNIPAGVEDGMRLRLRGEGHCGQGGGPPGDCHCILRVRPHPLFVRREEHLVCSLPITYAQAALGASVEVPTLDGRESLTIPPGTQPGDVFTLRGRGMPRLGGRGRGDLLVEVQIEVPRRLAPEHEELLRRLAEIENKHVTPRRKSFFETLKEYLKP